MSASVMDLDLPFRPSVPDTEATSQSPFKKDNNVSVDNAHIG